MRPSTFFFWVKWHKIGETEQGFSQRPARLMGFHRQRSYSNSYTICMNNRALLIDEAIWVSYITVASLSWHISKPFFIVMQMFGT